MREYQTKAPIPYLSIVESEFLWAESFQGAVAPNISKSGSYAFGRKALSYALIGDYCLELGFRGTSSVSGNYSLFAKPVFIRKSPKMSLFTYVVFQGFSTIQYIDIYYTSHLDDLSGSFAAWLRYNTKDWSLSVRIADGSYTKVGTVPSDLLASYAAVEIIFDTVSLKYKELRVGPKSFDISDLSLYQTTGLVFWASIELSHLAGEDGAYGSTFFGLLLLRALPS